MKPLVDYGREDIVRFLYLEPIIKAQRVLVIGPENETVKDVFRQMGCRSVKLFLPGKETRPQWDLAVLRGKRDISEESRRLIPFPVGLFDLIFISDLTAAGDCRLILSECARIAGETGKLILAARNAECTVSISQTGLEESPEIWSLLSLEELAKGYFKYVESVGQCPFLAYALISFDPERVSGGVRLDTSLMGDRSEEPEFYLLLCSQSQPGLKIPNAIYQVPITEMTLTEAPTEAMVSVPTGVDVAQLKTENELLKKEVAEKNVLLARLGKEIERLEAEAEERRQKMFEMAQKMQQDRKEVQKEVLEKAIQKQVDRIPETWLGEREALLREIQELKESIRTVSEENKRLKKEIAVASEIVSCRQEESSGEEVGDEFAGEGKEMETLRRRLQDLERENEKLALQCEKSRKSEFDAGEMEVLKKRLEIRERLIRDLIHELELMPQIGYGEDIPAGEQDVLELIGRMEEMKRDLAESGKNAAALTAKVQQLHLSLQECRVRAEGLERENGRLQERVEEVLAINDMLADILATQQKIATAGRESRDSLSKETVAKLRAIIRFCLDELQTMAEKMREERIGRDLALLWAKIEEKRRLADCDGGSLP